MALKLAKNRFLPIGVDIGSSTVKLVQLRLEGNVVELVAADCAKIPADCRTDRKKRLDFLVESIRSQLTSRDFKSRQCVLSLPAAETLIQHVKLPKMSEAGTASALRSELNGKLPYPVKEAIIRHIVAGEVQVDGETRQEVIVIAAHRPVLDEYLKMARKAELDVTCVNVEPCAIVECFSRLFYGDAQKGRRILFVDMGATTTQVVLSQGGKIVFARNLEWGSGDLDKVVAEGMGVTVEEAQALRVELRSCGSGKVDSAEESELHKLLEVPLGAMASELTQCLRYYQSIFRNHNIDRVIFVGGQAYDKQICQLVAKKLNLPAQVGDPMVNIRRTEATGMNSSEAQPDWAVAVGLSLGADQAA